MGSFLTERISSQPLTEFWRYILSGCQVCDWGIQYHLCGAVYIEDCGGWWFRGVLGLTPADCRLFTFLYFHLILFPAWGKMLWAFRVSIISVEGSVLRDELVTKLAGWASWFRRWSISVLSWRLQVQVPQKSFSYPPKNAALLKTNQARLDWLS